MSLKSINLNLIPVLRELLRLRSVSAAGRALGRSPSAVSEALAQLRMTFDDPLLVRTGGKMVLTPRAGELLGPVEEVCARMEIIHRAHSFDPSGTERLFVIAAHDFHVYALGPALLELFRERAPGFQFRFVDLGRDLPKRMLSRDVDFALMPDFHIGDLASARLRHVPLTEERTIVMMRERHPLAAHDAIDADQLGQYLHIGFHPNWEPLDSRVVISPLRRQLKFAARTAQISLLPYFLVDTDYLALGPEALALHVGPPLGLTHRSLAQEEPSIKCLLAWSPILDADPAHHWFRQQVRQSPRFRAPAKLLPRDAASIASSTAQSDGSRLDQARRETKSAQGRRD